MILENGALESLCRIIAAIATICIIAAGGIALAQSAGGESLAPSPRTPAIEHSVSPVIIDGEVLFSVPGTSALPAAERAGAIAERITEAAERSTDPPVVDARESEFGRSVSVDGIEVILVTSLDAEVEGLDLPTTAKAISLAVQQAILDYRERRTSEGMIRSATSAVLLTVGMIAYFAILFILHGFARKRVLSLIETRIGHIEARTGRIVRADAVAAAIISIFWLVAIFVTFVVLYYYLTQVLMSFPATRNLARILLNNFLGPIRTVFNAVLNEIPDLVTIAVITIIAHYIIRFFRLIFLNMDLGRFEIAGFEPHWVWPTFRIVKFVVILFAIVVAYPYIPGSGTAAFKGVTIFLGVLLSFGSSSVISNLLAGLFVIYRRSVNIGDIVSVAGVMGRIETVSLLETHLRSPKNELVSVPNSQLLASQLTNFTQHGGGGGLLIHSTVGIGYEEPHRKIEKMLIEAVHRTPGLESDPPPFVLRKSLADFAVNYEVNAYARKIDYLPKLVSALNSNILDVFNEQQVQIMTPAYEGDPEIPKIAPLDYSAPITAKKEA